MTFESAIAFSMALFLWVLIPGPAVFAVVGRSLAAGFRSSVTLIAGILIGDLFYLSIVLFGMAAIGRILGDLFIVIRMAGAVYLVVLGLQLWFRNPEAIKGVPDGGNPECWKTFLTGFSVTLGNPKAVLFHLGFLPAFFDLSAIRVTDAFCIAAIFLTVVGGAFFVYAYAAGRAGSLFRNRRSRRILDRGAGTILIGAGIAAAAAD